jgi:Spy/CpxP family protein refolding chaperone
MQIWSKIGLAVVTVALSCAPILAQGGPQDQPPPEQFADAGHGNGPGDEMSMNEGGVNGGGWGGEQRGPGWGGERGRMGGERGERQFGLMRLLDDPTIRQQAGISAEQVAKIRQQNSEFRKTQIRERADLEVKRIDLRDLISADKPDRASIDSKLQEISAAQLALEKSSVTFRLNMREAITPAQREKLQQIMSERRRGEEGRRTRGPAQERKGQRPPNGTPGGNPPERPQANN